MDTKENGMILSVGIFDCIMPNISPTSLKVLFLFCREACENYTLLVQLSLDQICGKTGIKSENTIREAIKQLENDGHITSQNNGFSPSQAQAILRTKIPQRGLGSGLFICMWCGAETLKLQTHHYPIPAKDDGTRTVMICANCHYEYHILVDQRAYKLREGLVSIRGEV